MVFFPISTTLSGYRPCFLPSQSAVSLAIVCYFANVHELLGTDVVGMNDEALVKVLQQRMELCMILKNVGPDLDTWSVDAPIPALSWPDAPSMASSAILSREQWVNAMQEANAIDVQKANTLSAACSVEMMVMDWEWKELVALNVHECLVSRSETTSAIPSSQAGTHERIPEICSPVSVHRIGPGGSLGFINQQF